jgi:hypothetical protein
LSAKSIFFCIDIELLKDNDTNYDKIKHLVEVDDDILAVFIVESSQIRDLYIANNANIDRTYVDSIFDAIGLDENDKIVREQKGTHDDIKLLGKLRWVVSEYENVRVLKIIEKDSIVVVLVNSNTQLLHTIDNILGYYYDADEIPKSLFSD